MWALIAFIANYWDLYWALDSADVSILLRLPQSAFDNQRDTWAGVMAQAWRHTGDTARTRAYADTARAAIQARLAAVPDDGQSHAMLGLMLAYLGQKSEAIKEGERAVKLWPVGRDAREGVYYEHQLIRTYLETNEPEKALDHLETLLRLTYMLTPAWLKIDPNFASLRGNPRFERLVSGKP